MTNTGAITHAFVAFRPCGHPIEVCVDETNDAEGCRDTAKFVAGHIRNGTRLERVTLPEARKMGVVYCDCDPKEVKARNRNARRATKRRTDDKSKARVRR